MGVGGLIPTHHLHLRGPLAVRYSGALRRVMRVLHAGRLVSGLEGRVVDDPGRSLLRVLRGRPDCGYSGQTRALAVPVGATALPSTPGRLIFDLRPPFLGRMDTCWCLV